MGGQIDWLERCDWGARTPELGELVDAGKRIGVAFPAAGSGVSVEAPLWQWWCQAGEHANLVGAIRPGVLRYAALDFAQGPVPLDAAPGEVARWASWGIGLVRLYEHLARRVGFHRLGWMALPRVWIDLGGVARAGFTSAHGDGSHVERLPPEILDRWPRVDERAVVFVIGRALVALAQPSRTLSPAAAVLTRCLEPEPARRFQTMEELAVALYALGGRPTRRRLLGPERPGWKQVEDGLALLAMGWPELAEPHFRAALEKTPRSSHTEELLAETLRQIARAQSPAEGSAPAPAHVPAPPVMPPTAAELELQAAEREAARDFGGALALYRRAAMAGGDPLVCALGSARAALACGDPRAAALHAEAAIVLAPMDLAAHAVRVAALLRERDRGGALAAAEAWLAVAPADGAAHVARGKALLGVGRLAEAREAFARACAVAPGLIEALWLRREAERMVQGVRAAVGTAAPLALPIPEHLAALREAMATGQVAEGIALLARAEHAGDAVAQLLLGELLAHDQRRVEALAAFERAAGLGAEHVPAALLGRARVLLELGRAGEVLALCERIAAARPEWSAVLDVQAEALARLGRREEAEAAARAYAAAAGGAAQLRVRG